MITSDWPDGFMWGTGAPRRRRLEGAPPAATDHRWEARRAGAALRRHLRSPTGRGLALYAAARADHHRRRSSGHGSSPSQGQHDAGEVERYRTMLRRGATPACRSGRCLHHFTLPGWFADDLDGFLDDKRAGSCGAARRLGGRDVRRPGRRVAADQRADSIAGGSRLGSCRPAAGTATRPPAVLQTIHQPAGADAAAALRRPPGDRRCLDLPAVGGPPLPGGGPGGGTVWTASPRRTSGAGPRRDERPTPTAT